MKKRIKKSIIYAYNKKQKIAKKLAKILNPTIKKWDKKVRKKTNNAVSLSSPFSNQKGGMYRPIPHKNRRTRRDRFQEFRYEL